MCDFLDEDVFREIAYENRLSKNQIKAEKARKTREKNYHINLEIRCLRKKIKELDYKIETWEYMTRNNPENLKKSEMYQELCKQKEESLLRIEELKNQK